VLNYFLNSGTTFQGFILSFICLFFSLSTLHLLRKIWAIETRPKVLDIHGHIFGVIGIVYAVLAGAVTIGSWEKFNHADALAIKEASSVITIYNSAPRLGSVEAKEVQTFLKHYLEVAIYDEWPKMKKNISPDLSEENIIALTKHLTQIELKNKSQELFIPIVLQEVNYLRTIREQRLFIAESTLTGAILQLVFLGGFLTLLACIFLESETSKLNSTILLSILSILIGLVLAAIIGLDHPYKGNLSISSRPLESALSYMNSMDEPAMPTNKSQ
jgi:hypothetical protein